MRTLPFFSENFVLVQNFSPSDIINQNARFVKIGEEFFSLYEDETWVKIEAVYGWGLYSTNIAVFFLGKKGNTFEELREWAEKHPIICNACHSNHPLLGIIKG